MVGLKQDAKRASIRARFAVVFFAWSKMNSGVDAFFMLGSWLPYLVVSLTMDVTRQDLGF